MATRTTEANVPLLEDEEQDEHDIERGSLPNYAEATQSAQRVGFVAGAKPNSLRHGKDPVALGDISIRLGKCLIVSMYHVFKDDHVVKYLPI